jgi:tetratricopeptide (TPR) repeat protein
VLEALEELAVVSRPVIGLATRIADDKTFIAAIAPDTPAARDGRLAPGDELVGVGEGREGPIVKIRSLPQPDVRKLLTGKPGSTVRLEVIPKGKLESVIYELQRDSAGAWLQSVVEMADSDPWRCKRRESAKIEDLAKRLEALTELSAHVDISVQPVRVLTRLADELQALGQHLGAPDAWSAATKLLRKTQAAYPGDLWANASLANVLRASNPPHMEEAIRYYTAAIALRPQSAGLHLNMGIVLESLGRVEEADAAYRASLQIAPYYSPPRCNLVDSLIRQERSDEAEALAREAVERWPNAATYANLGRALARMQKNKEASDAYREALRLDPTLTDGHSSQAMELFGAGKTEAALEKFREVVAMDPAMAGSHYNLGRALGLMGRLDEACEAYRTCLKLDPNEIAALTNLTHVLREQGRQEEAVQACRDVLARKPDSSIVCDILAGCLLDCDREEEAVVAFRESIRLYPRPQRLNLAYVRLARLLAKSENPAVRNLPEAIALATQAVEMAPAEELAWEALAIVRFHNQEWQASIEAFQKSEQFVDTRKYGREYTHSPVSWANNYLHRAMAHWQLGQVDQARAWFVVGEHILGSNISDEKRALLRKPAEMLGMSLDQPRSIPETIAAFRATLQTDPDGFVRHNSLAWILATAADSQHRDPAQALAHAQRAVQLMPQDDAALHTLGVAHYRNGQWNEAIEALHRSMELSGISDWHALILAMAHWQRGEQDEARRWYDGVVESQKGRGNASPDEELERLRAEAEALFGIAKTNAEPSTAADPSQADTR